MKDRTAGFNLMHIIGWGQSWKQENGANQEKSFEHQRTTRQFKETRSSERRPGHQTSGWEEEEETLDLTSF